MSKVRTYFIRTYGCQMNEADSEKLAAVLESQGYQLAKKIEDAEIVVINTCSVRESAENRVFGLVNKLTKNIEHRTKGKGEKQKIILTGCMVGSAQGKRRRYTLRQLKLKLPKVDEFKTIEELVGDARVSPKRKYKTSALVLIMEGCNHFCSYCVVPYARGPEKSRPFEEIICEVEELIKRGYKEIMLLGQNVNSYGKDFDKDTEAQRYRGAKKFKNSFANLLCQLHQIRGLKKISFVTSNPWGLADEIIEAMKLPKIDRHFHLPVQSGDDQILKRMNRPYTAKQYLDLAKKIRKEIPDVKISTDIIVGFPGETKKAFGNTVKLCQKVSFEKAYIARYSPRSGTAAFKLEDNVLPEEKKRRWRILENLINQ